MHVMIKAIPCLITWEHLPKAVSCFTQGNFCALSQDLYGTGQIFLTSDWL